MSLVADYGVSSESESEASTSSNVSEKEYFNNSKQLELNDYPQPKLPSATTMFTDASAKKTGEVLSNPFLEAEQSKMASLERHVKMVTNDTNVQQRNGRKICWNHRKGRCRFGTGCQYAHDSDILIEGSKGKQLDNITSTSEAHSSSNADRRCKRPGLGDGIQPSKRVLKSYQQTKRASALDHQLPH